MDYITPQEAAAQWGISLRRVQVFCAEKRIPGAKQMGRQWLIPADARRPGDGRKRTGTKPADQCPYHFPFLVYSPFYARPEALSEDERRLLEAQILTLRGDYVASAHICNALIAASPGVSVRFGAVAANVYNNILLGQYTEVLSGMQALEAIRGEDPDHEEDYRLIITALGFQFSYDDGLSRSITVGRLSPDALILYRCFLLQMMVFSRALESTGALRFFGVFCRELEDAGIAPALVSIHGSLAMLCERAGDMTGAKANISDACHIAHEDGLLSLLAKVSMLNPDAYRKRLKHYGEAFVHQLDHIAQQNMSGWRTVFNSAKGVSLFPELPPEEGEIMLLLSYGMSNKAIADIKGVSEMEMAQRIGAIGKALGYSTKAGLAAYAKRFFILPETPEL